MSSIREGIADHRAVEVFEAFADVMRRHGLPEQSCQRIGHYAALRTAGVERERALSLAGIERPAGTPEGPAHESETTRQA